MILSSRQTPPSFISLPEATSYNFLSVESAKDLLLRSPIPSPSLPAILPRHGKKPPKLNTRRAIRYLVWLTLFTTLVCLAQKTLHRERAPSAIAYQSTDGKSYEIVGEDALPDYATPIVVTDHRGRSKWTVSIPPELGFPLSPADYADICAQAQDVSQHVSDLRIHNHPQLVHAAHHGYYWLDPNYMDVADAQSHDLLPHDPSSPAPHQGQRTCTRSLTFALESSSPSLGTTLLALWLAYGLSLAEGRAFFIDDTRWAYGSYGSYFIPPPTPPCLPPPSSQRVPCPHQAAHLVVSAATALWVFGGAFHDHFEDAHRMGVSRQWRIFGMMREGYEKLFRLAGEDGAWLQEQLRANGSASASGSGSERDGVCGVGIHVRHGDRHPFEFQYSESYVPLGKYLDAAQAILQSPATSPPASPTPSTNSTTLIASDDPDVYLSREIADAGISRAQSRISLASKKTLGNGGLGWEGGFFANVFRSLGVPPELQRTERSRGGAGGPRPSRKMMVDSPRGGKEGAGSTAGGGGGGDGSGGEGGAAVLDTYAYPPPAALRLREYVARAYLLDIAVLGGCERGVVCAVSSASCRVLGVMVGWEGVVSSGQEEGGRESGEKGGRQWRNVDGGWGWRGLDW